MVCDKWTCILLNTELNLNDWAVDYPGILFFGVDTVNLLMALNLARFKNKSDRKIEHSAL